MGVVASTMDAFAARLLSVKDSLPVVTAELGDTWIHGAGTDPKKTGQYRELLRLAGRWLAEGRLKPGVEAFSRSLLLVPEHTWGLDVKTHLADFANYAVADFRAARQQPNYLKMEASWDEQRGYIESARRALPPDLAGEADQALSALTPARPSLDGYERVTDPGRAFETAHFAVAFDGRGTITRLVQVASGRDWAGAANPLGLLRYQTFSQADYDRFYEQYVINKQQTASWSIPDLTKPGIAAAGAVHGEWTPALTGLYHRRDGDGQRFILTLAFPAPRAHDDGRPAELVVQWFFPDAGPAVMGELQWFDKPACRLPEALWCSFTPVAPEAEGWRMDKLGQSISPLEVIHHGNRRLHAIGTGVTYRDRLGGLAMESLDAALVAPGDPALLDFSDRQPALAGGMHFLLYNNVWGTNFPMWYGEDARFRFVLRVG